jgi:hypothetical protein
VACNAAHEGTVTGVGAGLGVGVGLGSGLGVGLASSLGEALAPGDADGLLWEATPFVLPQAATANIATTAASLIPTGKTNECVGARVTRLGFGATAHTISPPVNGAQ